MNIEIKDDKQITNHILNSLPELEFDRILPHLERTDLNFGDVIYEAGQKISHVYFINSGVVSLLACVEDDHSLEVGLFGNGGMLGLPAFLGADLSSNRAVVQGGGNAMRMTLGCFRAETENNGKLSDFLKQFTRSLMAQVAQTAVCNRYHATDARLSRWLLTTADIVGADHFPVTQEFLSHMLGVRREAVNKAAISLHDRKLITYSRGNITIDDRAGLEGVVCSCFRKIKDSEDREYH